MIILSNFCLKGYIYIPNKKITSKYSSTECFDVICIVGLLPLWKKLKLTSLQISQDSIDCLQFALCSVAYFIHIIDDISYKTTELYQSVLVLLSYIVLSQNVNRSIKVCVPTSREGSYYPPRIPALISMYMSCDPLFFSFVV